MKDELESFFTEHNIEAAQETVRSYIFDCPACGGSKKLYIQKENGQTVCFKQGDDNCPKPRSKPEYALSLISGLSYALVKAELYEGAVQLKEGDITVQAGDVGIKQNSRIPIAPITGADLPMDVSSLSIPTGLPGRQYLEGRGITYEMMVKYRILYSEGMRRVIFPVIMDGQMYGWQGRAIDKVAKEYRMYNLPGEWKSRTLMFKDNIKGKDFAIIAEGAVSALKFEKVGGFVATMGKAVSRDQLEMIAKSGITRVYLALDRDAAENTGKIRDYFQRERSPMIQCYLIEVPEHRDDFGDCTFDECEAAFNEARPLDNREIFVYLK